MGGLRAEGCEGVPVAFEDVLIEEANPAVADTHGRGGETVDIFAVQEVVLRFRFSHAVGGCVVELREEADFADIGLLGALALATELKSCKHLLTQWGHEIPPFVNGRLVV